VVFFIAMTRITFREIKIHGRKTFKCSCGKRLKRSKTFSQTINPFNLHNGLPKTYEQILIEIYRDKRLWEIAIDPCSHKPETA
jgi:hypothetical protein